jgi:hypothetical protein
MTDEAEMDFLLRRAQEESILAIREDATPAGAVHRRLAQLYSAKALVALAAPDHRPRPAPS